MDDNQSIFCSNLLTFIYHNYKVVQPHITFTPAYISLHLQDVFLIATSTCQQFFFDPLVCSVILWILVHQIIIKLH